MLKKFRKLRSVFPSRSVPTEPPARDAAGRSTCGAIRENIELISRLEEKYLTDRTFGERMSDIVGSFCGSVTFVVLHFAVYGSWVLLNLGLLPALPIFDAPPFTLLSTLVSLEAIFLATFVLMKQNRMSKRADSRAHLDLQINLLAEKEMTIVLKMLRLIGSKVGVNAPLLDREMAELSLETPVEVLAGEIAESLPKDG
jgi:uncharacterized membrane protein